MKHFRKAFCSACILTSLVLFGCGGNGQPDGYGNFESTEIIVSSEASGKLLFFPVEEGEKLDKGQLPLLLTRRSSISVCSSCWRNRKG